MGTITEKSRPLEHVLAELGSYSRDTITVAQGEGKLEAGTVVGMIDTSKKFIASPDASVAGKEGAESALAVLAYNVDASSSDTDAVIHARITEFKRDSLKFESSVDDDSKIQTKLDQLKSVGLIAR